MSKIGDYIGDRFPNVKNAWGTLEAKILHNGIVSRLRFFGRNVKVTVVNAYKSFTRSAKDTPLHVVKLHKRDIQLRNAMMSGAKLNPADMVAMAAQGDAAAREQDLKNLLEFMKNQDNLSALEAGLAKAEELAQQERDRLAGLDQGLIRAGQRDGLEVLQADQSFAEAGRHASQRKDWQSMLTVYGDNRTGTPVHGAAYFFAKTMDRLSEGGTKDISLNMRDQAMVDALQANLRELKSYQQSLDQQLDQRYEQAKAGHRISPRRLSTLQRYAAHDAIAYTLKCIDNRDAREHLMQAYRKDFGGVNSIRPVLQGVSTPAEFKQKIAEMQKLVGGTPEN